MKQFSIVQSIAGEGNSYEGRRTHMRNNSKVFDH
jgi:hypothetical protein